MSKLSYEDKIEIHKKKKQGSTKIALAKEYDVSISIIDYIYRILVNGESITSVTIDEGLPSHGMLSEWFKY